jgi:purine-binding chemotaxis protein CheW
VERTASQRESWSPCAAPLPALAAPPQAQAIPAARMVIFRAGGERFALPLEAVREVVVPQPPFARVPRAGAAVKGGMNLRGRVVAVVELAPLLGLPPDALGPAQGHVLVLERDRRGLGLLVAAVLGVDAVALPGTGAGEPGGPSRGVAAVRGAPVTVLDPEALEARAAALFGAAPP